LNFLNRGTSLRAIFSDQHSNPHKTKANSTEGVYGMCAIEVNLYSC
jgi:hypothetical protein